MEEWHVVVAAIVGLGLVSYVLQETESKKGLRLWLYLASVVVTGALGALVFLELDYTPVFGAIVGVATVAFGATLARAVKAETKKVIGRLSDRFSAEKEPGYTADSED
jgi:drug/metabolite transporter (DMT)-like permease